MMKKLRILFVIIVFATTYATYGQESNKDNEIIRLVDLYQQELNNHNIEGVVKLFAEDGILLLQGAKTCMGSKAVETFYSSLFKMLSFNLKFNIEEVVQISPEWAFIRTSSTGIVKVLSNNSDNQSEGHELFILKKQMDGNWKIARYSGASAK